jgi:transposase
MMPKKYRRFTKEFKLNAIQLMSSSDKPITQLARELDLRVNQLYKWKNELSKNKDKAFKRTDNRTPIEPTTDELMTEVSRLRKENEKLQAEKDILKKATAYFANECK